MRMSQQPPADSTHCAFLFIRGRWNSQPIKDEDPVLAILSTNAARTMSPKQRELVSTLPFKFIDFGKTIGNHTYFRVYGVGEYDTQKMVKALIEALENKANKEVQHYLNKIKESKEKIAEIKQELPDKQKQLEEAELIYKKIKNARYSSSLDDLEVYTKAKETMFQMDKMLDSLEIELAGIQEKLKKIEQYQRRKYGENTKNFSPETLDKLDQMYVEQMIELSSAKARQNTALKIRDQEKEFINLSDQWSNLQAEVNRLKRDLENSENNILTDEKILANPLPEMRPPKVYQNKVTIYPVK
jgi:chromosome segregation ATPase